jgi:hypothetical protein
VEKRLITRDSALATSSLRDELLSIFERGMPPPTGTPGMPPRRMPVALGAK